MTQKNYIGIKKERITSCSFLGFQQLQRRSLDGIQTKWTAVMIKQRLTVWSMTHSLVLFCMNIIIILQASYIVEH